MCVWAPRPRMATVYPNDLYGTISFVSNVSVFVSIHFAEQQQRQQSTTAHVRQRAEECERKWFKKKISSRWIFKYGWPDIESRSRPKPYSARGQR